MLKYLFLIPFTISILASCGDPEEEILTCRDVAYDVAFVIEAGNSYCFPDEVILEVTALNNAFCPCNLVCVWEGQMTVDMEWTFPGEEPIEYIYQAGFLPAQQNDFLPDGIEISADQDEIVFEEECSDSNPNPEILEAVITVRK